MPESDQLWKPEPEPELSQSQNHAEPEPEENPFTEFRDRCIKVIGEDPFLN
jgi:hypothetical protein